MPADIRYKIRNVINFVEESDDIPADIREKHDVIRCIEERQAARRHQMETQFHNIRWGVRHYAAIKATETHGIIILAEE